MSVNATRKTVLVECTSCSATGLYRGFCEKPNEPVVCLECDGSGAVELRYTPYTGRKRKNGVTAVRRSRGSFIATGVGGHGDAMTYEEFRQRYPEKKESIR